MPFALSDPERVRSVLSSAGFTGIELEGSSEPMWFGHDAGEAQRFVIGLMGWMLRGLDDGSRQRALDDLRTTLAAHDTGAGVLFQSATWFIRANRS